MKTLSTICFLLVCLSPCVHGQDFNPMDLEGTQLEKKYASLKIRGEKVIKYEVDNKGKVSKQGTFNDATLYNAQGKAIKTQVGMGDFVIINEMEYNEKGDMIKICFKDGDGNIHESAVLEFDTNRVLLRTLYYDSNGKLTKTRNPNPKVGDCQINYGEGGKIDSKECSKYDSLSRTYISRLLSPTDSLLYENKYLLNQSNQILEWSVIDNIQMKQFITKYRYNKQGNRIEELQYDKNGNLEHKFR